MAGSLSARVHGGLSHGGGGSPKVDLSVNINPYGPCEPVLRAVSQAHLDRYPDPAARDARRAWALALATREECIAVAHGATDLLWAIVAARTRRGGRVLIAEPTFSELRIAAEAAGAEIVPVWARQASGFAWDMDQLKRALSGVALAYLCSPNNPTGVYTSLAQIRELAASAPTTWIVVDQSFLSLSDHAVDAVADLPDNVLALRSLTKDYALPGLRIGLLWAHPEVVAQIEAARPSWSTSACAQAAIVASASARAFVSESWQRLRSARSRTATLLARHGLRVLPTSTAFHLVEVGDARGFQRRLLQGGVLVRDCTSFGLSGHIRIAACPEAKQHALHEALACLG